MRHRSVVKQEIILSHFFVHFISAICYHDLETLVHVRYFIVQNSSRTKRKKGKFKKNF